MKRYWILLLFLLAVFIPPAFAEDLQPTIKVSAVPTTATIGDPIYITVTLQYPKEFKLLNSIKLKSSEISLKQSGDLVSNISNGIETVEAAYIAKIYDVGEYTLPSVLIEMMDGENQEISIASEPVQIVIESVLPDEVNERTDIRDIKGVAEIDPRYERYTKYLYLFAGFIISLILILLTVRKLKQRKLQQLQYMLNPYEEALHALEELKSSNLIADKRIKLYYLGLTDIIRRYFERKFGFSTEE